MAITMKYDKPTALRIRDFLLKQGLTVEGTYGLMANLYTESGFRSNNAQNSYMTKMGITDEIYTARVDSCEYKDFVIDKVGYGLAQWTSSGRKQALYNYSKSNNVSISNETMQLDFLMKELSTSYKPTLNVLKTSHSIRDCAKYVMTKFERPADQSENAQNKRADYGEQLYKELNDVKGSDNDMAYTNSSLVSYVKLSPNKSVRTHKIDTITIHCMAGNLSVETCGNVFSKSSRQASSNYGIGSDGRIAMYVEEKDRSWCSSNSANDNRAITIEVANDGGAPDWHVSDKAMESLIKLCADICKRNGISKLVWSTNKSDRVNHKNGCNMTVHRDYQNKSCPGAYLYNNHSYIASEVNKILNSSSTPSQSQSSTNTSISVNQFKPLKGNPAHFAEIIKNIKLALNTDYGLKFTIDSSINDILLINLGNVVLSTVSYKKNITYALQQLLAWWGYNVTIDGIYGNGTKSTVSLFQSQVSITKTGNTTKEFWYKILGK